MQNDLGPVAMLDGNCPVLQAYGGCCIHCFDSITVLVGGVSVVFEASRAASVCHSASADTTNEIKDTVRVMLAISWSVRWFNRRTKRWSQRRGAVSVVP